MQSQNKDKKEEKDERNIAKIEQYCLSEEKLYIALQKL